MKSGQTMIEYILLSTAVVVVVITLVVKNGLFSRAINRTITNPAHMIGDSAAKIKFSPAP